MFRCLAKYSDGRPRSWDEVVEECAASFYRLTGQPAVLDFGALNLTTYELLVAAYSLETLDKPLRALTPLYVKTLVQAAWMISWRARKSVMTRW